MGMPVFAQMKSGMHVLVGPTAGYLWGFVIAAFLIGFLTEKGFAKKPISSFLSCFAATTIILITGMFYLALFKGFNDALIMGFYPFLVGDVVKSSLCAIILTSLRKF
jgi:biotin transporter BioY